MIRWWCIFIFSIKWSHFAVEQKLKRKQKLGYSRIGFCNQFKFSYFWICLIMLTGIVLSFEKLISVDEDEFEIDLYSINRFTKTVLRILNNELCTKHDNIYERKNLYNKFSIHLENRKKIEHVQKCQHEP